MLSLEILEELLILSEHMVNLNLSFTYLQVKTHLENVQVELYK